MPKTWAYIQEKLDYYDSQKGYFRKSVRSRAPAMSVMARHLAAHRNHLYQEITHDEALQMVLDMVHAGSAQEVIAGKLSHTIMGFVVESLLLLPLDLLFKLKSLGLLNRHNLQQWYELARDTGHYRFNLIKNAFMGNFHSDLQSAQLYIDYLKRPVRLNAQGDENELWDDGADFGNENFWPERMNNMNRLVSYNLTSQQYVDCVVQCKMPWPAMQIIYLLVTHGITGFDIKTLQDKMQLYPALSALRALAATPLFTQQNIENIITSVEAAFYKGSLLEKLDRSELLTQTNLDRVLSTEHRTDLHNAWNELFNVRLDTQENFEQLLAKEDLSDTSKLIAAVNKKGLLTQARFETILTKTNALTLSLTLESIQAARYVNLNYETTVDTLLAYQGQNDIHVLVNLLIQARVFPFTDLSTVLENPEVSCSAELVAGWARIPAAGFGRGHWAEIVNVCRDEAMTNQEKINRLRAWRIRMWPYIFAAAPQANGNAAGINNAQNTHTESVHKSTADSAKRLKDRYGDALEEKGLGAILNEIVEYMHTLHPHTFNQAAAMRGLIRLRDEAIGLGREGQSGIYNREILALSWLAIHDDKLRQGSLLDAKAKIVEGLYELQRGYNLVLVQVGEKTELKDNMGNDSPSCTSGTFNKIVEHLAGVHPDVEIISVTKVQAGMKLPQVVKEEVLKVLKKQARELESQAEFDELQALLAELVVPNSGLPDELYEQVKDKIEERMFEEFSSVYGFDENNEEFLDLIKSGEYTQMTGADLEMVYVLAKVELHLIKQFENARTEGVVAAAGRNRP